jgi:iron complex transport system substrate-binding protein
MKLLIFLLLTFFLLNACSNPAVKHVEKVKQKVHYAKHFNLIYEADYTILQILDPERSVIEKEYFLVSDSTKTTFSDKQECIHVPISNIAALSSTQIGMLSKLNAIGVIRAVSDGAYIDNPKILQGIKGKKVFEIQDFGQMNPERIVSMNISLLMYSGFGKTPEYEQTLKKLGVLCMPNYDWREEHPLGKAEWIKVMGALTGKEKEANSYFAELVNSYEALKKQAKAYTTKNTSILSGSMIGDAWYMPAAGSYLSVLFHDANCSYAPTQQSKTGSEAISFEEVLRKHQSTVFWFNPGFSSKQEMLKNESRYRLFTSFQESRVFCYSHNMNYFWENSAIEPHHVLSDFIHFVHDSSNVSYKPYFYQKIK